MAHATEACRGITTMRFLDRHHPQQQPFYLPDLQYKMNILFGYPTFVLVLIHFIINANCTNLDDIFWKRAREGSIDLNRTPSPDWSIETNKASPVAAPIDDIISTITVSHVGCSFPSC